MCYSLRVSSASPSMERNTMTDIEDYKRHISGVFTRASASYDQAGPRFFTHLGTRLVEFAAISPGARVLDVACGRGLCFLPNLERALAGFRRVLKPGAWLVASTFQHVEDEASERWDALDES